MNLLVLWGCLVGTLMADMYMQNPRGSNNRLNEKSAARQNGNRLFDSQNNARGGYNTGDKYDTPAGNDHNMQYAMQYYASGGTTEEASKLIVEWNNQHGCGGNSDSPHKTNCNIVFQMMCRNQGEPEDYPTGQEDGETDLQERNLYMRDGTDTNTQNYNQPQKNEYQGDDWDTKNTAYNNRMTANYKNVQTNRGLHETLWWYDMCRFRSRNKGLYIADQELKAGSLGYVGSERTRQNNNGNRRGYECPEERDYYPYWQPTHQSPFFDDYQNTPWVDIAYLTGNMSDCDRVNEGSENRVPKYRCVMPEGSSRTYGKSIDEESCNKEGGCIQYNTDFPGADISNSIVESVEACLGKCTSEEECKSFTYQKIGGTCWLKSKENGNSIRYDDRYVSANKKCFGQLGGGTWVQFHGYLEVISDADNENKCAIYANKDQRNTVSWMALRSDQPDQRYCVVQAPLPKCSQAPWTRVNHLGNSIDPHGESSRVEIDMPHFPSGVTKRCTLRGRYNITTDEFDNYGTDYRHNHDISKGVISPVEDDPIIDVGGIAKPLRLAMNTNQYGRTFQDRTHMFLVLPRTEAMQGKTLHNMNVRGKRGNIVQTFPAVEYDFIPNKLTIPETDLLHIQWTGSNTHNNGNSGGDGQTGDAGDGTTGTDRHNFLQMLSIDLNFPAPYEKSPFWEMVESVNYPEATGLDLAIGFATSGYYCGYSNFGQCRAGHHIIDSEKDALNQQLNNAPASYFGHVLKFKKPGTCVYVCTRNNNFTNRSQKGVLWVTAI